MWHFYATRYKLDLHPIIHTIIVFGILAFQIIGLISAYITERKYDKFKKSKKSIF